MRRLSPILPVLFLCHTAIAEDAAIIELREIISKIVDTQTLESKERLDWETQKAEMTALLDLHLKELNLLDEELEKSGRSAPNDADSTDSLKKEINNLKASRRQASEAIARNVPRTILLAKSLPTPLLAEVDPEISTLSAWNPTEEPREALRTILSFIAKAEQFNRRFTRSTEVIQDREVEVLYIGLARAFYAGKNNSAGIGKPSPDGWLWESRPDLHSAITGAFDTLDKKLPPAMIDLPMEID